MEADWAAEIGAGLARIDLPWAGWVDLRGADTVTDAVTTWLAGLIPEAADAALGAALVALNAPGSPVVTSKCDRWRLEAEAIDPFEFDATGDGPRVGCASYVDVVARDEALFGSFAEHEAWARRIVGALRAEALRDARVDLVVRAGSLRGAEGFALTVYTAGCGRTDAEAHGSWARALGRVVGVIGGS